MTKHLSLFAAAALAVGGFVFAQNAPEKPSAADRAAQKVDSVGLNEFKDAKGVRYTLETVTQAAVTSGGFNDLIERLVDADRNRIGQKKFTSDDLKELDGLVAQIQKDWKEKYQEDFKIKDPIGVYNDQFCRIEGGEVGDNARLAAEQQKNAADATAKEGDKNLEKGRDIATVTIVAGHNLPELRVPVLKETSITGPYWKINVPDEVDGQKLKDNLQKHLTMVKDAKDQWPGDPNEAYRIVTHHVLMALLDKDAGADNAGGAAQPKP